MQKLAVEAKLPEKAAVWLVAQGVTSIEAMALAATTEDDVSTYCIQPMVSANIEECKKLGGQAAMKKCWHACRGIWENERKHPIVNAGIWKRILRDVYKAPFPKGTNEDMPHRKLIWKVGHKKMM